MKRAAVIFFWLIVLILAGFASGRIQFPGPAAKVDLSYGPRGTRALTKAKYDEELQQRVDEVLVRIAKSSRKIFAADHKRGFQNLNKEQVAQLESDLGYSLPGELRALLESSHASEVPWSKIWTDWHMHGPEEIYQWSIGEYLSWCNPVYDLPSAADCKWGPGMLLFMSDSYGFLSVSIETGELYLIEPGYRYDRHSVGVLDWLNTIADRMENGSFVNNEDEFYLTKEDGTEADSPGAVVDE